MSQNHQFDTAIATQYGVNVAIFLNNIAFWIEKNVANNVNFRDGSYWTYSSHNAFLIIFPYWSTQNLRTIVKKCIEEGLIKTAKYNKIKYDHKLWYSLTDKGLELFPHVKKSIHSICGNQRVDLLEPTIQIDETNTTIEDHNTDQNTEREPLSKKFEKGEEIPLPKNFKPDEENVALAKERGLDVMWVLEKFNTRVKGEGRKRIDWQADFKLWILNEIIRTPLTTKAADTTAPATAGLQNREWAPGHPDYDRNH